VPRYRRSAFTSSSSVGFVLWFGPENMFAVVAIENVDIGRAPPPMPIPPACEPSRVPMPSIDGGGIPYALPVCCAIIGIGTPYMLPAGAYMLPPVCWNGIGPPYSDPLPPPPYIIGICICICGANAGSAGAPNCDMLLFDAWLRRREPPVCCDLSLFVSR
jgi:hypothetical protein